MFMKNSLHNLVLGLPGAEQLGGKSFFRKARLVLGLVLSLLLPAGQALAQAAAAGPEMADTLHQNGKIYVVVAVIAVVLAGLLVYLIALDRKLTRLEKEVHAQ